MSEDIESVGAKLEKANQRLRQAGAALGAERKGGEWEELDEASNEVLCFERKLAKLKGEPYAVPCDFPVKWDIGAPLPHLLCNDFNAFLIFYVSKSDPNWDGTYVNVVDPKSDEKFDLCLVSFERSISAKLGHPNEDVQDGHPLSGRGLDGYTAQIVKNSSWLHEMAKTNSVHAYDNPEFWQQLNHYIFWFHDTTFECVAKSYNVEVTSESMPNLLNRVCKRLL